MLLFEKVRWRNFLSTGNQWTEVVLNKDRSTLIIGKNGAGKSTLLDAITYALFGRPFRNINKPQLHNSIMRKGLTVELWLKINGIPYYIRRGDRPGLFEVFQDGKLLNQNAKAAEYQEVLEKQIIKCNFKSFCQIVILGSATYQPFMGLPRGNRREIIEDLLDLQVFTIMNKLLVQRINDNDSTISDNERKRELADQKLKLMLRHIAEVQENTEKQIEEKRERLKSTEQQIEATQHEIEDFRDELKKLRESISDEGQVTQKIKKLEQLRAQITHKIDTVKKEVSFFHDNENCPTCKQEIDEHFKHETIKTKKNKIEETESGLNRLTTELDTLSNRLGDIVRLNSKITDVNLELSALNTKVSGWNDYVEQLNDEITALQKTTKKNKEAGNTDEIKKDIKSLDEELIVLHDKRQVFHVAGTLLKDTGIKSKIVKQYIPIINKLINKYLSIMDFFVSFELNESFEETIKARHMDEYSYASFSEGEKMRINLAVLFTWRAVAKLRNSINTNLLIMDEVLDGSADQDAKDAFFQILGSLTDTNVFVISHNGDSLFEKFDSVIKFEKSKSFSKMVA
jgi:DNA repair exonuclease SbcCD ATPase subunit